MYTVWFKILADVSNTKFNTNLLKKSIKGCVCNYFQYYITYSTSPQNDNILCNTVDSVGVTVNYNHNYLENIF